MDGSLGFPIRISKKLAVKYHVIKNESNVPPSLKLITLAHFENRVFLFGGQTKQKNDSLIMCTNELFVFDVLTKKWSKGIQSGDIPSPRCAYSIAQKGRFMYLFGGRDTRNHIKHNDLFEFDMSIQRWRQLPCRGQKPSKRDTSLSFIIENFFYVYGGHESYNYVSDLYRVDLKRRMWEKITLRNGRPPLLLGQALLFVEKDEFSFYGGLYDQEQNKNVFSNEIFRIDLRNRQFKKLDYGSVNSEVDFFDLSKQPKKGGKCTLRHPTFGHTAFCVEKDKMLVMGGSVHSYFQNDYRYIDDVVLFTKTRTKKMSKIVCRHVGQFPSRCFSSMTKVKENKWVLFGGRTKNNMEGTNDMVEIEIVSKISSPFTKLLVEGDLCDTKVMCVDGQSIRCHSIFLFQSSVIRMEKMHEIEDEVRWIVKMTTFEKRDVEVVLHWLYGGSPTVEIERMEHVYTLALYLRLFELMVYLCNQFDSGLSVTAHSTIPQSLIDSETPLGMCYSRFQNNLSFFYVEHEDFSHFDDSGEKDPLKLCFRHLQRNRSTNCNFKLIANDGIEFFVHKEILVAVSEYFRKMLCGRFIEAKSDSVREDVPKKILELWIDYFYTNKVVKDLGMENLVDLCVLADAKCMFDLRAKCHKRILSSVNSENILQTILLTKPLLEHEGFIKRFSNAIKEIGPEKVIDFILQEAKDSQISISKSYSM